LFACGVALIGLGSGIFAHCTLTAAMGLARRGQAGMILGLWGAVQASAAGIAVASGGLLRDGVSALAAQGSLGSALSDPGIGYSVVYHCEIALLFVTLVALGPLVTSRMAQRRKAEFAPLQPLGHSVHASSAR
jgi:BCD family chlorophyll transporter-like MFS transporter